MHFTLDGDDGPMYVYYLMADTEDERASTYEQIMKWLKGVNENVQYVKTRGSWPSNLKDRRSL